MMLVATGFISHPRFGQENYDSVRCCEPKGVLVLQVRQALAAATVKDSKTLRRAPFSEERRAPRALYQRSPAEIALDCTINHGAIVVPYEEISISAKYSIFL